MPTASSMFWLQSDRIATVTYFTHASTSANQSHYSYWESSHYPDGTVAAVIHPVPQEQGIMLIISVV